jgi:hypothetical protein
MSPRGVRAVHGAEVDGSVHGHGHGTTTVAMPNAEWLGVTCWCERTYVAVPQYDVRWHGSTRSCGHPSCHPDEWSEGEPIEVGVTISASQLRSVDAVMDRTAARPRVVTVLRKREPEAHAFDVAVRRDSVEQLWRQHKRAHEIALLLGASPVVVRNDIQVLRNRGRIAVAS